MAEGDKDTRVLAEREWKACKVCGCYRAFPAGTPFAEFAAWEACPKCAKYAAKKYDRAYVDALLSHVDEVREMREVACVAAVDKGLLAVKRMRDDASAKLVPERVTIKADGTKVVTRGRAWGVPTTRFHSIH